MGAGKYLETHEHVASPLARHFFPWHRSLGTCPIPEARIPGPLVPFLYPWP